MKRLIILFATLAMAACGGEEGEEFEIESMLGKEAVAPRDCTVHSADALLGGKPMEVTRLVYAQQHTEEIGADCIMIRVFANNATISADIPAARLDQKIDFDTSPVLYEGGVPRIDENRYYNFFLREKGFGGTYVAMRSWDPDTNYSGYCRLTRGAGKFDFVVEWELREQGEVISTGKITAQLG